MFRSAWLAAVVLGCLACGLPYPFESNRATSDSMAPTIRKGETFVWRKFVPGEEKKFVRGDIVVFEYPPDAVKTVLHVKRVIGLPGETVRIVDDVVWIDGSPSEEPWGRPTEPRNRPENIPDYSVNPGFLYVLGDNRFASLDSRAFGSIPIASVRGIARVDSK